jgi:hypothetical protein
MKVRPQVATADSNALCPSPAACRRLGNRLALIFLLVAVTGCGSIYDFGDLRSGDTFEHKRYSAVVPIVPGHENGVWNRTADALDSNDLFLKSKWWYESEKRLLIYKAVIRLVDTRSAIRTMADLQEYVKNGGMEGVRFSEATPAETSQAHVLCVRPPLYSETTPKEGRGHFVQLMACIDTKTRAYYELAVVQDFINKDIAGTPRPSDALNVAADRFFARFKVN